ncbi:MAG: hypothetical protein DLM53_09445 [Candidatus Eremiobacter antarcticus]|nr:MAG: hypothetical protein DLM53_09445 [Candidatus Eremiobacter sp. RRmetagenome_bin22]
MAALLRTVAKLGLLGGSVACAAALLSAPVPTSADVDDVTQVLLLANYLTTGNYTLPPQPPAKFVSVYHSYALVSLNGLLPQYTCGTVANARCVVEAPQALPANSPSSIVTPAPSPTPRPAQTGFGPNSGSQFVAIKTHRNWLYLFGKAGSYSVADLVAAGLPKDIATGLVQFLKPPPSPRPTGSP